MSGPRVAPNNSERNSERQAPVADMSIGRLTGADETLHHQVVNTFGAVATTDLNWTEKIWAAAFAHDGSTQVAFGLGKYANRGVLDAYGGISRGTEQWTVRGSRALQVDDRTSVGPLTYEILEPLRAVRVVLEPNDIQKIAFDITLESTIRPGLEGREVLRAPGSQRVTNDVVRYHQAGTARGWLTINGERTIIDSNNWSSGRDHSWGVRNTVGAPVKDLAPTTYPRAPQSFTSWSPIRCSNSDGTECTMFHYLMHSNIPGQPAHKLAGGIEHPDGTVESFSNAEWIDTTFDDANRRFIAGTLITTFADGTRRLWRISATPEGTGFHLGTGLYFGLDGAHHGDWRGELHVDGDHFEHCDDPKIARRIHQLRDCVVRVDDGEGTLGNGVLQTVVIGEFPEFNTTLAATFL